ncbi:hypothetical protein IW150_002027 [Coemansia sp. RSA 2607]|nr:hypothetical protein IW150_002027 [Coemansia sp. RSA 2607]
MVWSMDIKDDELLVQDFKHHVVDALEGIPANDQDWTTISDMQPKKQRGISRDYSGRRQRSKCKVLRLIDPSLYTLIFDKSSLLERPITCPMDALNLSSFGHIPGSHAAWKKAVHELNQRMASDSSFIPINEEYLDKLNPEDRHWLPTDIYVNNDGSVDFKSYINNLHPGKYPEAYKSIAKVIAKCLPALEQVLTDWKYRRDLRIPYNIEDTASEGDPHPDDIPGFDFDNEDAYHDAREAWEEQILYSSPDDFSFVKPKRPLRPNSLRNKDLQVIIKMESVYSNPTEDYIPEEEWQGDGTASEQIIATVAYFYDIENIRRLAMEFREGVSSVILKSRAEWLAYRYLFVTESNYRHFHYEQGAGELEIRSGQAVCYPNVYQHRIAGIHPYDSSKPFHAKMLMLYFIDPSVRILSTSVVPPQQQKWWIPSIRATPLMETIPWFVRDMIIDNVDMPMPFSRAMENRKRLDDKTTTDQDYDFNEDGIYCISRFDLRIYDDQLDDRSIEFEDYSADIFF